MKMTTYTLRQNYIIAAVLTCITLGLMGCKEGSSPASATADVPSDLKGLVFEDIPGTDVKYARQLYANGGVEIEGYVSNGKRTGMWVQYGTNGDIGLINHYVDGQLEGLALRMTYRNQVDLKTTYRKGQLDGAWASYKFGKLVEERTYKQGKLEGSVKLYDERTFKLKQDAQYKNGLQDGYFRYYDEEGNVTLEYQYKNGEKVSGGMTNK
jgi:antitoxin component YwqK of YwqJK toxin-antitoxin module